MNVKKIGEAIVNSLGAILHGKFLMRLRVDKYFVHILYTCFLFWLSIWLGMKVEKTMVKVKDNNDTLTDLKIYHAQKTVQMVSINRISTVDKLLREKGSEVSLPEKPATRIKN